MMAISLPERRLGERFMSGFAFCAWKLWLPPRVWSLTIIADHTTPHTHLPTFHTRSNNKNLPCGQSPHTTFLAR